MAAKRDEYPRVLFRRPTVEDRRLTSRYNGPECVNGRVRRVSIDGLVRVKNDEPSRAACAGAGGQQATRYFAEPHLFRHMVQVPLRLPPIPDAV